MNSIKLFGKSVTMDEVITAHASMALRRGIVCYDNILINLIQAMREEEVRVKAEQKNDVAVMAIARELQRYVLTTEDIKISVQIQADGRHSEAVIRIDGCAFDVMQFMQRYSEINDAHFRLAGKVYF